MEASWTPLHSRVSHVTVDVIQQALEQATPIYPATQVLSFSTLKIIIILAIPERPEGPFSNF